MANPFADLVARLDRLPPHLGEIVEGIRCAIAIAAVAPGMALTQTRKVLEQIVHDLFEKKVGKPAGTRPLENLLDDLKRGEHLPRRVAAFANTVRELGNIGTHATGETMTRVDVAQSIALLLIIVDWYDSGSIAGKDVPVDESRDVPANRPRRPGAEAMLHRLGPLLEEVFLPADELLRLYRQCAPIGWEQPPSSHEPLLILSRCVESLAGAPRQGKDGLFPLLRFVRGLCDRADAGTADGLSGWIDESLAELSVDRAEALRLRSALDQSAGPPDPSSPACHLLVQVTPRLYEAGRYGVKAWLFGTGEPACLLAGEDGMAIGQVQACLDDLRVELLRRVAEPDRAWVELLLPRELLCLDVDQWRVEVDFLEAIPLGVEHRLVVRSLERASRARSAIALHARGKVLGQMLEGCCRLFEGRDGEAFWIGEEQCGGPGLYTTLRDAQGVVGAALGTAPHPCPRDPAIDVLNTLFAAGLPVVLWSRRPAGGEAGSTREVLLELLGREPLGRLPDRIWELRKQAIRSEDAGHIGRHLSLLWDDPARTSPDFEAGHRLRAPSREG